MRQFTSDHADWLMGYSEQVISHFKSVFLPHSTAFHQAGELLDRLRESRTAVISGGWEVWSSFDEAHNELCVAAAILDSPGYRIERLEYEPTPDVGLQTIDFRAAGEDGRLWFIDTKTIAPRLIDRWDQFEAARANGWLPGADLVLAQEWLGGELWHLKMASRSRMLEYTLELEAKLAGYRGFQPDTTILMLCSNGFHWHEDDLEDFVAFYADGEHRSDDSLAAMELHSIASKGLSLPRRVKRFAYCQRGSQSIAASGVNWWVRPPRLPASLRNGPAV